MDMRESDRKALVKEIHGELATLGRVAGAPGLQTQNERVRGLLVRIVSLFETEEEAQGREQAAGR